jgi:hypothetical protein
MRTTSRSATTWTTRNTTAATGATSASSCSLLVRALLAVLCTLPLASQASANDLEKLAQAVDAAVQAGLERSDPEQLALLRATYGPEAARAVGDLRIESAGAVETRIPPEGDVLADVLRSEPALGRLGSQALAGLLRRAYDSYAGAGHPVPDAVKVLLSITFSPELLDSVRVVDSDAEGSAPAILRELQTSFGEAVGGDYAVTIGNLIAFSEIPKPSEIDFWAHELRHVVQYRQLGGIDAFAAAYTRDFKKLEGEANAASRQGVSDAQKVLTVIRALHQPPRRSSSRNSRRVRGPYVSKLGSRARASGLIRARWA